jgi:hypothetical protein
MSPVRPARGPFRVPPAEEKRREGGGRVIGERVFFLPSLLRALPLSRRDKREQPRSVDRSFARVPASLFKRGAHRGRMRDDSPLCRMIQRAIECRRKSIPATRRGLSQALVRARMNDREMRSSGTGAEEARVTRASAFSSRVFVRAISSDREIAVAPNDAKQSAPPTEE